MVNTNYTYPLKKGRFCPNIYCDKIYLSEDYCPICGSQTVHFNSREEYDLTNSLPIYKFKSGELNYDISNIIIKFNQKNIITQLYSDDESIVRQSCFLLGKAKIGKSVDDLCNVLENSEDIYVMRRAILALASIGDSKALPYIIKYQNHRTKTVKKAVIEALSYFEKEEISKISRSIGEDIKGKLLKPSGHMKKNIEVPEWNEYYPDLNNCSQKQKKFYKLWLSEKENGTYLDIDGNLSYIFYYLYSVIFKFEKDKNFDNLVKEFDDILLNYKQYPQFRDYICDWKIAALFYLNRENEVFTEILKKDNLSLDIIINSIYFLDYYNVNDIKGEHIIKIMGSYSMIGKKSLTDFGEKNKKEISNIVTEKLIEFKTFHKVDIFTYFLNLTRKDYDQVKKFYSYDELKEYNSLKGPYKGDKEFTGFYFYYPFTEFLEDIHKKSKRIPSFIYFALICELKRIIRESENKCRKQHGVPPIGEGWVSETELYYQIKNSFKNEIVISHAHPKWLGRQHLDIYFPEHNIGIEYQGEQHYKAIDLFGGEKGLKHRKELDKKKYRLCKENNCNLIYVYPEYNYKKDVLDKINEILEKNNNNQ